LVKLQELPVITPAAHEIDKNPQFKFVSLLPSCQTCRLNGQLVIVHFMVGGLELKSRAGQIWQCWEQLATISTSTKVTVLDSYVPVCRGDENCRIFHSRV